jgi:CubicO group peptidase (beta-lactamase class C family)
MRVLYSIFAFLFLVEFAFAKTKNEKFDELIQSYVDKNLFTGSVLIAEKNQLLFSQNYGYANREHQIPHSLETKFRLGSITKQFTATAIMLLQEDGLLSVQDTVAKHIPHYPEIGAKITIHQLLTHTSGIPDVTDLKNFEWMKPITSKELVDSFASRPLDFIPGSKWAYSNSGYMLLGYIIEQVSGKSYEEFLTERIFRPAKLNQTVLDDPRKIISNRAQGYDLFTGVVQNCSYIEPSTVFAAGALLSSAHDLWQWDKILYGTEVLSDVSKGAMFASYTENGYGYGWANDSFVGHKRIRHGGAISGFLTEFARYTDDHAVVIVLNNTISGEPNHDLADALAAILFDKD